MTLPRSPARPATAGREHVLLLDRAGYRRFHHTDGRPFLDPEHYDVSLLTTVERAGEAREGEVSAVLATDTADEQLMAGIVAGLSAAKPLDRVLAISERLLLPAARLRKRLGVAGASEESMLPLRDKLVMKRHLGERGVTVPEHMPITRAADAATLLRRHGAVVVKPTLGMGTAGVYVARSPADLAAVDQAGFSWNGPYQAEEFIEGTLYHIDSIVAGGRPTVAVASQYLDPNDSYLRAPLLRSAAVEPGADLDTLLAFNEKVLAAFDWFTGATHLEAFLRPDGSPVLCEIAGRPGGGGIIPSFRHLYGVDLYEVSLAGQLAGIPPPALSGPVPADRRFTGFVQLYAPAGLLAEFEPAPAADWVLDTKLRKKPGARLRAPIMSGDAVAIVTVCGPDRATVINRLDEVARATGIIVKPEE
jgi:L-amino acid ligase C-terminal domain 2/ATP-grasp domain